MATTAEVYGFGARAPYAQPRASEYDMKERVRLSGLFPRVRNEPMSKQLQVLMKEFEQNAALTGIVERRRRLEERRQFELQGTEGMDALNRNLAPPFRAGLAGAAVSADVADRLVRSRVAGQLAAAVAANAAVPAAPDAAAVMTSGPGVSQTGGSTGRGAGVFGEPPIPVLGAQFGVASATAAPGTPAVTGRRQRGTAAPGTPAQGRRRRPTAPGTPQNRARSGSQG